LAEAPRGETEIDFPELLGMGRPVPEDVAVADFSSGADDVPESVIDIAESLPVEETPPEAPLGGLTAMAEAPAPEMPTPVFDMDTSKPAVVSEAPVAENLLTAGLAPEQPVGGLNAVSQPVGAAPEATPEAKMANSMGFKATDITKPIVATVGNLLKQTLRQQKRPAPRAPAPPVRPARPTGGLQTAGTAARRPPPQRMDVAGLIPIKKAAPAARVAPPKTLAGNTKLSPVTDIATLTSLVKKTG
jgi:hypothetical protein